jgi:hypothetical protein
LEEKGLFITDFHRYRTSCLRSRIIKLPEEFVEYIREDGIILADDEDPSQDEEEEEWHSSSATNPTLRSADEADDSDSEPETESLPPNKRFPELHQLIKDKIAKLGGAVVPKLNWSAPKDAAWISPHQNTLKCTSPNDIYLLLKSSSFISHDLDHAFDDCAPNPPSSTTKPYTPVLVLRPLFTPHLAMEFRCFVKHRTLIGLSQRDLNYYAFLTKLRPALVAKIKAFFDDKLKFSFTDNSFTFDVYIPEDADEEDALGRVRLIDINPWAPRTDSLLFDWKELLDLPVPRPILGAVVNEERRDAIDNISADETTDDDDDDEADEFPPELRLVGKHDPVAYNFSSSQYSAHKLPKEVVDASLAGEGGLAEFARQWKEITEGRAQGIWEPDSHT